jgi:agmatinase
MSDFSTTFDPGAAAAPDSGIYGLPYSESNAKVIVVPVPFAATTSYGGGAERGPDAVLRASKQVDLFDLETGRPYEAGIAMVEISDRVRAWNDEARSAAEAVIDAAGAVNHDANLVRALRRVNEISESVNRWVYDSVHKQLERGRLVALVGGDHAVPYGAIHAHAERFGGMGILHIDAHADLREAYEGFIWSHASIMYNVITRIPAVSRLVQVGIRDLSEAEYEMIKNSGGRIVAHFDPELSRRKLAGEPWSAQTDRIVADLPPNVYVSFDIDGLDPTLCPHTGTPVPGGLSFQEAMSLVAAVVRSGRKIVGIDLNEVVPGPEGDEWDGNVGARVLYKMIGWMLLSQGIGSAP